VRHTAQRLLTVQQALHECIRSALDLADSLVIEYDHLAAHHNGTSSQREQRNVDIPLPKMADEVNRMEYGKRL
jgi:hypothetical protein